MSLFHNSRGVDQSSLLALPFELFLLSSLLLGVHGGSLQNARGKAQIPQRFTADAAVSLTSSLDLAVHTRQPDYGRGRFRWGPEEEA